MVQVEFIGLDALSKLPNNMKGAVVIASQRTLNKVGTSTNAHWARQVKTELNLPISTIKYALRRYNKSPGVLEIHVDSRGAPGIQVSPRRRAISLINFDARQTATGVSVKIKSKRVLVKHAFIAKVRSSANKGVYMRIGKPRLPIRALYSTSIEDAAENSVVEVDEFARESLNRTLPNQINFELRRAGIK